MISFFSFFVSDQQDAAPQMFWQAVFDRLMQPDEVGAQIPSIHKTVHLIPAISKVIKILRN